MKPLWYIQNPAGKPQAATVEEVEASLRSGGGQVCYSLLPNGFAVSTIFLHADFNHGPTGPPLFWESLVFDRVAAQKLVNGIPVPLGGHGQIIDSDRYSSIEAAQAGHDRLCLVWGQVDQKTAARVNRPAQLAREGEGDG